MNALRTVSNASRAIRFALFVCLLALLAALTPLAASAAPRTGQGGLGQALALMASLHASQVRAAAPGTAPASDGFQRTPNGRVLLPRGMMRPGALRGNAASGSSTTPIPGAVQTFDVNNPSPAFQPLIGFQNSDGSLGNNAANAPVFQPNNTLAPTNLTPVWSGDEKFLIFSSNRTLRGDVNTEGVNGGSRFHLWAISVNGGEAFQITTSSAIMGEDPTVPHGEFFPTLTPDDGSLAFTSDAQSSGTQNLFVVGFSFSALLALNNTAPFVNVSNTDTRSGGIQSVTLRAPAGQTTFPTEAQSAALTGFDQVQRPTFLGTSAGELVFSARSVAGANAGRNHLYFLFTNSGGSDPSQISFPGQLTDGPADDTDPASTKDGQFVAFASTATTVNTNRNATPTSQTSGGTVGGNRSIFLLGGGGTSGNGLGVVPTSLQATGGRLTASGTDNFGPAWSFNVANQFTNPSPGFEYLAFARGASQTSPHDIFYMQTLRFVNAGGESARSIEAATTPQTFNAPVYQINAGDLNPNDVGTNAGINFGNYRPDTDQLFNNGFGFFTGGTAETINPAPLVNTTNDPGTPAGIFLTDRHGTFSYTLPNLTPDAFYTVRLHLSDPNNSMAGQRLFNVTANGAPVLTNFDIVQQAGGQNTAIAVSFPVSTAQVQNPITGQVTFPRGQITLNFTPTNPAKGDPIVEGIEVLAGATVRGNRTPSSGFGAFTAAVDPSAPQNLLAIGGSSPVGSSNVTLTFNLPGGVGGSLGTPTGFNIFRSPGSGTSVNQPGTGAGQEGAFALFLNVNPTQNPNTGLLTFVDTTTAIGTEYYYQVDANFQEVIVPEGTVPLGATAPNAVIKLNTDDNAGEIIARGTQAGMREAPQAGNSFDDVYPAWAPGISTFSITYASNRTVTYNDPTTSFPSETAISVAEGGLVNTSDPNQATYTVGTAYSGIFESQVLNLDPPTLLRFNPNEIIHVQSGNIANPIGGVSQKVGIAPGQKVTFTVRLTDREAGIDNTGAFTGGPAGAQVFLQIKNPNSKYQDAQNLEHKVFAKDSAYNGQTNQASRNDTDGGTANTQLGLGFNGFSGIFNNDGSINQPFNKYLYPPYGTPDQLSPVNNNLVFPRGAHGGQWTFPDPNNPDDTYIFIGKAGGGNNPGGEAGGDPALFIPRGPEYECQLVNPQFLLSGNPNASGGDTSPADFRNPYYLAGVDDQQAFSGRGKTRPVANTTNGGANVPAEWLQMTPVPAGQQDHRGGVLYTVTWTTPVSASDFFLDVIAYDQAVFPNIPAGTSNYTGGQVNWRIYDNVGGFSTVQTLSSGNNILVVSDYALGQKFAATTFAGRNSNLNLVPKLFGTESYLTDVDVNILPDVVYAGTTVGTPSTNGPVPPYFYDPTLFTLGYPFFQPPTVVFGTTLTTQNGLGVGSYYDQIIDDGERRDGAPNLPSQRYTIWRTLARGPVTDAVLAGYLPSAELQPAINDPQDTAFSNIPAARVLNAPRCVVWLSPYAGDLLTDPGSLNDPGTPASGSSTGRPSTQSVLRNFVLGDGTAAHPGGGRLFITGQDVASTLTIGGTVGNAAGGFLPDVLNAREVAVGGGSNVLAATANRITGSPFYDNTRAGRYLTITGNWTDGFFIFNLLNYPYQDNLILGNADRDDAALSQVPAVGLSTGASIQGRIDTIAPANGATVAATYGAGGPAALVFHNDPFIDPNAPGSTAQPGMPNGGTGSRTVFAAFGMEAMSSDYYASISPAPPSTTIPPIPPPVIARNPRQAIIHNIVCYLRSATVTGVINQTAGAGVAAGTPVTGATVYLRPTGGAPPTRAAFSATTGSDGRYTINGIEPGTYTLVAYKPGFARTVGNNGTAFTFEGGTTTNNGTLTIQPLNPGSIAGNVKDTSGNAVVGATITFTSTDKTTVVSATSRTGLQAGQPAGSYFVDNVPVATYTAVADGPLNAQGTPEYKEATAPDAPFTGGVSVVSNTTTQPVNFTLTPILATVSGRVFDTVTGGPSAGGATVNLVDGTGKTVLTTTAAADGTYAFTTNVPPGTYTVTVTKAGFGQATPLPTVTVTLGETFPNTNIGITPLASISGQIFDTSVGDPAAGAPAAGGTNVAGATVTLTSTGAGTPTVLTTSASATGAYTFANVAPGTYKITAAKVGFTMNGQPVTVTVTLGSVITSPATDIGLTPIPPGSLKGTVRDANGNGVANAVVTFVSADGTVTLNTTADANGAYTFGTVFPGSYFPTATGPINPNGRPTTTAGHPTDADAANSKTTQITSGQQTTQDFSVTTIPPSLSGTITSKATGKGLASALVTITDTTTGAVITTVKTDANGKYSTGPLPASGKLTPGYVQSISQYTVTITASLVGFASQALPSQNIYDGDALTDTVTAEAPLVDIALVTAGPGTISGQVTDLTTGAGVSGAKVTFVSTDGTTTLGPATTDANGNYVIPTSGKAPSGNYVGTVTSPLNANGKPEFTTPPSQTVTIPPNGTQTVNFVLTEILASLSGTVLDNQTGKPIPGATVTLTDSTGKTIGTPITTGADGSYSFTSIPAGQAAAAFNVSATVPAGYFPGNLAPVPTLSLGDSLTGQNIRLDEQGTITGLVTDASTGQPLPNVALTVTNTTTGATVTTTTSPLVTTPGTTIGPDGKTSNYIATFVLTPGDTYAVSASKSNFNPSAAVTVSPAPLSNTQVGRADIKLTSGIGTLGGLVSDATTNAPVGGATVTVTSTVAGVTTTVATFTTNGSISPAPDGKTQGLNYSGQVAQGTYKVTLTFGSRAPVVQTVTVVGGQFNRLDFTGANGTPPLYTFPAGLQFLSTPYDYSSLGFDALFGILNTAPAGTTPNGNRTHVAVWNPLAGQYALDPNPPADSLRLGVGYWVFLKNPVPVTVQGATPSSAFVPVVLHPDWNQIGVPNIKGIPVSSLMFDNGAGGMISFATAASTQYHVVSPTLYSYDGNAYQPVTQSGVLQPWKAYWIKVFANATVEMPTK